MPSTSPDEKKSAERRFRRPHGWRRFTIPALLAVLAAIPLTLFLTQQQQDLRQRAAGPTITNLPVVSATGGKACTAGNIDAFLVIDKSESMERDINGKKKLAWAKEAANSFVDLMATEQTNYVGIASFSRQGGVSLGFTKASPSGTIKTIINNLKNESNNNGTCLECAMIEVNQKIAARKSVSSNKKFVIILSDGNINYVRKPDGSVEGPDFKKGRDQAKGIINTAMAAGTQFYLLGIGVQNNDGQKWLKGIADSSNGKAKYIYAGQGDAQLQTVYKEIALTMGKVSISGTVFEDTNNNSQYNAGQDAALPGVTVNLRSATSTSVTATQSAVIATAVSDANGKYTFTELCAQKYIVSQEVKDGYIQILPKNPDYYPIDATNPTGDFTNRNFGNKKITETPPTEPPPTASPSGDITFTFGVALHGLGVAGDNILLRPNQCKRNIGGNETGCLSNQQPLHVNRELTIEMLNDQGKTVATGKGAMTYSNETGIFKGDITITSDVQPGKYAFRASTPMFLKKKIDFAEEIEPGKTYTLPIFDLTSSDVETGDTPNKLTILDYNMIVSCYQFPDTKNPCSEKEIAEVDNDDNGVIDEFNINLFVRDVKNSQGD